MCSCAHLLMKNKLTAGRNDDLALKNRGLQFSKKAINLTVEVDFTGVIEIPLIEGAGGLPGCANVYDNCPKSNTYFIAIF